MLQVTNVPIAALCKNCGSPETNRSIKKCVWELKTHLCSLCFQYVNTRLSMSSYKRFACALCSFGPQALRLDTVAVRAEYK